MNMKRLYNDNLQLLNDNINKISTNKKQDEYKNYYFVCIFSFIIRKT